MSRTIDGFRSLGAKRQVVALLGVITATTALLALFAAIRSQNSDAAPAITQVSASSIWGVGFMNVEAGGGQSNNFKTFQTERRLNGQSLGFTSGVVDCAVLSGGVCTGGGRPVQPVAPYCQHPDFNGNAKVDLDEPYFAVCGFTVSGKLVPPSAALVMAGDAADNVQANFNGSFPVNHRIEGERGADDLTGSVGVDTIYGGDEKDVIDGREGSDQIFGGAVNGDDPSGEDEVTYRNRPSRVKVTLGDSLANDGGQEDGFADRLTGIERVLGGSADDELTGGPRDDYLSGGYGNDTLEGGGGADTMDGGRNYGRSIWIDTVRYAGPSDTTVVMRRKGSLRYSGANCQDQGAGCERDQLTEFENVETGSGNDTVYGDYRIANTVRLGSGRDKFIDEKDREGDIVYGGPGIDELTGGKEADKLHGEGDDDVLVGGYGPDLLTGGSGYDTADYSATRGPLKVTVGDGLANDGAGRIDADTRTKKMDEVDGTIEVVKGSKYADELTADQTTAGAPKRQELFGNGGNDQLTGGHGPDVLWGGIGNDILFGKSGSDDLSGDEDADWIFSNDDGSNSQEADSVNCGAPNAPEAQFDTGDEPRFEDWADVDPLDAPTVNECENIAEPPPEDLTGSPFEGLGAADL